jgi:hypothetical protein
LLVTVEFTQESRMPNQLLAATVNIGKACLSPARSAS